MRRLAAILNDTGLTEIEVERGDLRIRVARSGAVAADADRLRRAGGRARAPRGAAARRAAAERAEHEGEVVNSPMVGTVYLQPEPGAAAVRAGRRHGQPRARPC